MLGENLVRNLQKPIHIPFKRHRKLLLNEAPGTLPILFEAPKPRITVLAYGPDGFEEFQADKLDAIRDALERWPVTWINVDGLGDTDLIEKIGNLFELHGLALEDVLTLNQRPKVEEYNGYLFMAVRMLEPKRPDELLDTEQISMFVGQKFVLSFQEHVGDCFESLRKRIRESRGRIRTLGADYLAYSLLDAIVDAYFPHLDTMSECLEQLENEILYDPTPQCVSRIHRVKRNLILLRRIIWPFRESINTLFRGNESHFTDVTRIYLRDCYDHLIEIADMVDTFRELTSSLLDVYLSSVSNRMNQVVKILTVISTIFIPLTFLAGLYGMNFDYEASPYNMPELKSPWGYPLLLLLMFSILVFELVLFWRKGWIGGEERHHKRRLKKLWEKEGKQPKETPCSH